MQTRRSQLNTDLAPPDLLDRARRGDGEAWSHIVRSFGPKVQGYARGKGIADAEDVVQDVFTAAARGIGSFEGDWDAFRSWIFSIAYRQIVNRYRSRARHDEELPATLVDEHQVDEELPATLVDEHQVGPDQEVVLREMASEAVMALDVLSDVERDVVLLRLIAGLDTADVAKAVGKREGNVRVIQFRALSKVRAELEGRGYMMEESRT